MTARRNPSRPHVVMTVGNEVSVDTRVKKTAASLARMGLKVTIVGYSRTARQRATMAGCDIVRVPIPWVAKALGRTVPKIAGVANEGAPISDLSLDWRRTVPEASDYVKALLNELLTLEPDVIHAHDVNTMAAAAIASRVFHYEGRDIPWIYDAHEFVAGLSLYGKRDFIERAGWLNLEQEFAPSANKIITVSPDLADELHRRYPTTGPVHTVLNAPHWTPYLSTCAGVRAQAGLSAVDKLIVYSGVVTAARGIETLVEAMARVPRAHLAIVSTMHKSAPSLALQQRAKEFGVADRVHLLPPVAPDDVVAHLSSADLGTIPIQRFASHDVALTNKLFEYIHAGLPVAVSDCIAQQRFVRQHDIGVVHTASDPTDAAFALNEALDRLDYYKSRVASQNLAQKFCWQESEAELKRAYIDLLPHWSPEDPSEDFPDLMENKVD